MWQITKKLKATLQNAQLQNGRLQNDSHPTFINVI